jgi:hypothetical protein
MATETAFKAVDANLTSAAFVCGSERITYAVDETFAAADTFADEIYGALSLPANRRRGIAAVLTIARAVSIGRPGVAPGFAGGARYLELAYDDETDVLDTWIPGGGPISRTHLSLSLVYVVAEVDENGDPI